MYKPIQKHHLVITLLKQFSSVVIGLHLAGCVAVATQIASSVMTHSAERIITNAYKAKLREEDRTRKLPDTQPDEYWFALHSAGFEKVTAKVEALPNTDADNMPINVDILATPQANNTELVHKPIVFSSAPLTNTVRTKNTAQVTSNMLVTIEVWSLIIGHEKNAILEEARLMGASQLPIRSQWQHWQIGLGELVDYSGKQQTTQKPIIFLIPPDFERHGVEHHEIKPQEFAQIASGQHLIVELASPGEINIARYSVNNKLAENQN